MMVTSRCSSERQKRARSGVDLGKLAVVADQHQFRVAGLSGVGEEGEVAGPDHARLVDDEHAVVGQFAPVGEAALAAAIVTLGGARPAPRGTATERRPALPSRGRRGDARGDVQRLRSDERG